MTWLSLLLPTTAFGGVVINEILADPGTAIDANCDGVADSTDDEFVEIVNVGPGSVNLNGATLSDSLNVKYTFGNITLAEGDSVVVFGDGSPALDGSSGSSDPWCVDVGSNVTVLTAGTSLSLNNSGDTVTLADSGGGTLATMTYGTEGGDKQSLVLSPEFTGSAYVKHETVSTGSTSPGTMVNFSVINLAGGTTPIDSGTTTTPVDSGTTTTSPTDSGTTTTIPTDSGTTFTGTGDATGEIKINEFVADATGADSGYEWIELYNAGTTTIDLSSWTVEKATSGAFSTKYTFDGGTTLTPGSFVTVAGEFVLGADWLLDPGDTFSFGNASSNGDAIRLVGSTGLIVDTVIYGPDNSDGFEDDDGNIASSVAPKPPSGGSLGRITDGVDSNNSGADFASFTTSTLGQANDSGPGTTTTVTTPTGPVGDPSGPIKINEFLADAVGGDSGYEWVELYNDGGSSVDITGWTIEKATSSSYSTKYTFPAGTTIGPGVRVTVGGEFVTSANLNLPVGETFSLGNASSNGDAIRLVSSASNIIDTVIYGPDNADGFEDDTGAIATSVAPVPVGGASIGRITDGQDTDESGADFALFSVPTLGDANDSNPGTGTGTGPIDCDRAGDVKVNEFLANPAGADAGLEWVELFNPSNGPVDISGWKVAGGTSSFSPGDAFPNGTLIGPGQFMVIGGSPGPSVDVVVEGYSLGNATSNSDGVGLLDCGGTVGDRAIYGNPNDDLWEEDDGSVAASPLPEAPKDDQSIGRTSDGVDTDNSGADFSVLPFVTPGKANDSAPDTCGGPGSGVVINEFVSNPEGSDEGFEWIELYNAGASPVDLTGWAVQAGSSSFSNKYEFEGGQISPGDFLVVGGEFVSEADIIAVLSLGNATSSGDGIRLVDCGGFPADTVVYGPNNEDEFEGDDGRVIDSLAPAPGEGTSSARVTDGYDTNASAVDFAVSTEPSPGAPNPEVEPVVCTPSTGGITINEFVPDPDGEDDGYEWVELYNSTGAAVSVAGWKIAFGTSDFEDVDVVIGGGIEVPANGFLVIGGENSPEVDYVTAFSIGNGTDTDGIRLFDCEGTSIDTALYGDEGNIDMLLDDNGTIAPSSYGDPGSGASLARKVDGGDTNSSDDWSVKGKGSPGETNVRELGEIGEQPNTGGCGCGSKTPGSEGPPSLRGETAACSTSSMPFGAGSLLVAFLVSIRRRRW